MPPSMTVLDEIVDCEIVDCEIYNLQSTISLQFVIQRAMIGDGYLILSGLVSHDIVFAIPSPCEVA